MARRSSKKLAKARHLFTLAQAREAEAARAAKRERRTQRRARLAERQAARQSLAAQVHATVHASIAEAARDAVRGGGARAAAAARGKRKRANSNAFASPVLAELVAAHPNASAVTLTVPAADGAPRSTERGGAAMAADHDAAAAPPREKRRRVKLPKSVRKKLKRQEKYGLPSAMHE